MLPKKQGLYSPEFEHDNCGAGFICSLKGEKTNNIIPKALNILTCLEHRGAVSSDGKTGDGAGILIEIPHDYFVKECDFKLPKPYDYAVGMVFLPQKINQLNYCVDVFEKEIQKQGLNILGWRNVPINSKVVGSIAAKTQPVVKQVFIEKDNTLSETDFNTKLYISRKIAENEIYNSPLSQKNYFYFSSLHNRTLIYKGLLIPEDIDRFYLDLKDPDLVTRLALVHQRFSTNTFPTWDLAQPFRYMCHNGEINTIKGNVTRMNAREELMKNDFIGKDLEKIFPTILKGKSDSAQMDMVVELLLTTGRSLPEVMMMMVPEAWEKHKSMSDDKKAFYEFNSSIMEPWDGPASIPFTDGKYIGALLDRNGLRPSRYTVTKDGYVVMSSETGVVEIKPENIESHGRLEPGKMFLVDMSEGRIIEDEEIKNSIVSKHPYRKWVNDNVLPLKDVPYTGNKTPNEKLDFETRLRIFGYTQEDLKTLILPMCTSGKEAIGSMGTDTPLAVLSTKPQLLFNYFKQLFAQVTNPPLDGIREEIVTDTGLGIGSDFNIFDIVPDHCKKLKINNPIISNEDLDKIRFIKNKNFKTASVSALYDVIKGHNGIEEALDKMVKDVNSYVDQGYNIIIISDRGVSKDKGAIPILLACSNVHHVLMKAKKRSKFGIVIESSEPREPHHFSMLFGYGASAINPYLVNEIIEHHHKNDFFGKQSLKDSINNYNKAIDKGILKVMNKIGISTLHSYRGAQIFEALGLRESFTEKYFSNTPTRIEGIGLYSLEKELSSRHLEAFTDKNKFVSLEIGGNYRWRRNGEAHMLNPSTISKLQQAVKEDKYDTYKVYSDLINKQSKQLMTLRGMFKLVDFDPIPIEEVEPWTEIVKRFKTGAMSYGSISKEAHENLAIAMNSIGGKSNSGEGGEDSNRFKKEKNGVWKNSAIKQVASGRFGVSSHYLSTAKEIQIKMAQGAKPGEGGQLPGPKVNPMIAEVRNSTPYVGLISPPPHHDIYSIEDLSQLIYDLKNANREARINVKLVSEVGVGTIAAGVAKAKADVILISGFDGGTGASPLTSLKHAGLPWELGIAEAQQTLVMNNLRGRVVMECDGQLKTGRDVAIACLLGAEEFGFSTAPLVASGCIMMRACHLNTCPVGIATQDPELRKNFKGKPEHVINFMYFVAQELREIMSQLGFRTVDEMVGQSQKINMEDAVKNYKTKGINLSKILYKPNVPENTPLKNNTKQDHNLENVLDFTILKEAKLAIEKKVKMNLYYEIKNTDRTVGTIVSNEISKLYGAKGLPKDTLEINFKGAAGQSFGAFGAPGLTLTVSGNTNDYFGKGLSGSKIIVKIPKEASFKSEENVITGNVALYGATAGEAYINGIAGERFCVRNSGAIAVVEGVGDHGCEYMTGGTAIILGDIGRNFAAGMSGGVAYIYKSTKFDKRNFNSEMIEFENPSNQDLDLVKKLIENHFTFTSSKIAERFLNNWDKESKNFIKIMPTEYKLALEKMAKEKITEIIK
ncbi:glutamate synthase large subunit [Flavobacteriaceae bacterium]|nr:glutamate synthase large subunit [Flavobacteriaceae bacterium]MDB9847236.1 glutamate synthase large subunit [Flavobacteriaceae bacterium]MDC0554368.1 glutamate synthase large subunit [Flavobacteriaceae bacterium]MDC3227836.1 glutamate synthase large subunit [Flavobacteriaceae bacterium]